MRDMDGLKKQHILQILLLCNLVTTVNFFPRYRTYLMFSLMALQNNWYER